MNATEQLQAYRITVEGLDGLAITSQGEFSVEAAQSRWVAIRLQAPYGVSTPGSHPIHFHITALYDGAAVTEKSVFLLPRP
jgi:hypothetical protein